MCEGLIGRIARGARGRGERVEVVHRRVWVEGVSLRAEVDRRRAAAHERATHVAAGGEDGRDLVHTSFDLEGLGHAVGRVEGEGARGSGEEDGPEDVRVLKERGKRVSAEREMDVWTWE